MKCVFVADDGKNFDNKEECQKYEDILRKKEEERKAAAEARKKKERDKDNRRQELRNAWTTYQRLKEQYEKDYPSDLDLVTLMYNCLDW